MIRVGKYFSCAVPDGWSEESDGTKYEYRGPGGEELIVSGTSITGSGSQHELARLLEQAWKNAVTAVKSAAEYKELVVLRPLQREDGMRVECWTLAARTNDERTLFMESIFRAGKGILLATFEGPNTASAKAAYLEFQRSVNAIAHSRGERDRP